MSRNSPLELMSHVMGKTVAVSEGKREEGLGKRGGERGGVRKEGRRERRS